MRWARGRMMRSIDVRAKDTVKGCVDFEPAVSFTDIIITLGSHRLTSISGTAQRSSACSISDCTLRKDGRSHRQEYDPFLDHISEFPSEAGKQLLAGAADDHFCFTPAFEEVVGVQSQHSKVDDLSGLNWSSASSQEPCKKLLMGSSTSSLATLLPCTSSR